MMVKQVIFNFQDTNKGLFKGDLITAQNDIKLTIFLTWLPKTYTFKQLHNFYI